MTQRRNKKKLQKINFRQIRIAQIREANPDIDQIDIVEILVSKYGIKRVTQQTISNDLKALNERTLLESKEIVLAQKKRITEIYEYEVNEAANAWEKSKQDKKTSTTETVVGGKGGADRGKGAEKIEEQYGNPAHLARMHAGADAIAKLYGLDAPVKQDVNLSGEIKTYQNWSPDNWDEDNNADDQQ